MRQRLVNLNVDNLSKSQALEACEQALQTTPCKSLFFINAHCFNIAQKDQEYHAALNSSDLVFNDGIGIRLFAQLNNIRFHDNLNGTDLIPKIIELGIREALSFYIVGSSAADVRDAIEKLAAQYADIRINGAHHGFFSEQEEMAIIRDINEKNTDILIVGMGVPKQELWIGRVRNKLQTVRLCIAGGAIIDFISGRIQRAPRAIRCINMEWFYRLCLEPRRLWKRYLVGAFIFGYHLVRSKVKKFPRPKSPRRLY